MSLPPKVWTSLVVQSVKNLPAVQKTWVQSLGWDNPLGKEMANHFNIVAWKIPWTEEPGGLQSMGLQRVRHDWATEQQQPTWLQGRNASAAEALPLYREQSPETQEGCVGPHFWEMLMGFHTLFLGGEHPLYSVYNLKSNFLELCWKIIKLYDTVSPWIRRENKSHH